MAAIAGAVVTGMSCRATPDCPPSPPGWLEQLPPADCVSPTSGLLSDRELDQVLERLASAPVASTIGVLEGPDEQIIGVVNDVVVDSRGYTIIADDRRDDVRVYDQNGRYTQTVGIGGSGPGEFRTPHVLALDSDGVLYVEDYSLRVQRFGLNDGMYEYVDQFRLEMAVSDLCILRDTLYVQGRRLDHGRADSIIHKVTLAGELIESFGQVFLHPSEAVTENYHRGYLACIEDADAIAFMPYQVPKQVRLYDRTGSVRWITRFPSVRELIIEPNPQGLYSQAIPEGGFHALETMSALDGGHLLVQLALWTREQGYSTRVPVQLESYAVSLETGRGGFMSDSLGAVTIEQGRVVQVQHDPFPQVVVRR